MNKSLPHRPYHHGDLYEQLLNAGEAALSEMSVEKVTLREIARRAGVSHAAPKHHFPTLGHLLGEIGARGFRRFVVELADAAQHAPDQTGQGRLIAMCRAYLHFAETNPAAYQMMFGQREPMVMTANLNEASAAAWQQIEMAASDLVGPEKSSPAALHVWSTVHGLALLKLTGRIPPRVMFDEIVEGQLRLIITGLK